VKGKTIREGLAIEERGANGKRMEKEKNPLFGRAGKETYGKIRKMEASPDCPEGGGPYGSEPLVVKKERRKKTLGTGIERAIEKRRRREVRVRRD